MEADYVIVGGGTAGLVVAHRLKKKLPDVSIIVIEAGPEISTYEHAQSFAGLFSMQMSPFNWAFQTRSGLADQNVMKLGSGGKAIGGSATINAGVWYRGAAADYDTWAEIADERAWRYENMIPFFKLSENLKDSEVNDEAQHARDGYLRVWSARARLPQTKWPLRQAQLKAWKEAGIDYVPDPNNGKPNGLGEQFDVWDRGRRQFAFRFLDLEGIRILSATTIQQITFDLREKGLPRATTVRLVNGECVKAKKEIIISAGTYNSPKILMLSGIGDAKTLAQHGIDCVYDNPHVGSNLAEHLGCTTVFKLQEPGALGALSLVGQEYEQGFPADYTYHGQVDRVSEARHAGASAEEQKFLSRDASSNVQICAWYIPLGEPMTGVPVTTDGTTISAVTCLVSPTSRGSVTIRSANPEDPPIVDQNFHATKADQFLMREGLRKTSQVFIATAAGKSFVEEEVLPAELDTTVLASSDEQLDARVRRYGWSIQHPTSTCALGSVVDGHCRVKGVEGLRVVDASIMPTPLGTNTQCATYAIAERAAEWIAKDE